MFESVLENKVELEDFDVHKIVKARKWCRQNFGEIPLKTIGRSYNRKKYSDKKPAGFALTHVYDQKNARWLHRMKQAKYFYFRNQSDAIQFKLVWY